MDNSIIELISNESGDWKVLKLYGEVFAEGHEITSQNWIDLIRSAYGTKVATKEISDEDMEEGNF